MLRTVFAVAVLLVIGASGWGQEKRPDTEEKSREQQEKEYKKRVEAHYKKYPTELPDLMAKAVKPDADQWAPTVNVTEAKDDPPAVAAAKRAIQSEWKRFELLRAAITGKQFSGAGPYLQLADCANSMYQAAAGVWDDPVKLLPFAENVVVGLMRAEEFSMPRVLQGVEEPQLLPQLSAARCRAEAVVLKLREQINARPSQAAPPGGVQVFTPSATADARLLPPASFACPCQTRVVRRPLLGLLSCRR